MEIPRPPLGKREAQINAAPDGTRKGNFRTSKARFNRARGWESPRAAVGTSKARTNAAAPIEPSGARVAEGEALAPKGHASGRADAQVGLNGDFSRTMAFGEMRRSEAEGRLPKATAKPPARARGERRLNRDCEPRKSASHFAFISPLNRLATTHPPPKHHFVLRSLGEGGTPRSACGLILRGLRLEFAWT